MKVLLDTQILLWGLEDFSKLTEREIEVIASPDNTVYFSPVSVWEVAIKSRLGKLEVSSDFADRVRRHPDLKMLSIKLDHVWGVRDLPVLHSDPFDRLLISQALSERMRLVTRVGMIRRYAVDVL